MQYTAEELRELPIHLLRGVDIKSADEEKLVQLILDERTVAAGKPVVPMYISSAMTDAIKTKEDELALQNKINEYNEKQFDELGQAEAPVEEFKPKKVKVCVHCLQENDHLDNCVSLI